MILLKHKMKSTWNKPLRAWQLNGGSFAAAERILCRFATLVTPISMRSLSDSTLGPLETKQTVRNHDYSFHHPIYVIFKTFIRWFKKNIGYLLDNQFAEMLLIKSKISAKWKSYNRDPSSLWYKQHVVAIIKIYNSGPSSLSYKRHVFAIILTLLQTL